MFYKLRRGVIAWRRGDKRVSPAQFGRIYANANDGPNPGNKIEAKSTVKATISMRIWRAATQTWENP